MIKSEFIFSIIENLGVFSFAVSGAVAAIKNRMDLFGMFVLACVTTFGGGVLRDIILDVPVVVFKTTTNYIWISIAAALLVQFALNFLEKTNKLILIFDSVGLAIFTVVGTQKALDAGATYSASILLAIITATGGGLARDVLCNKKPLVLYTDFYAAPSFIGAAIYILLKYKLNLPLNIASTIVILLIFGLRLIALLIQWRKENKLMRV